MPRSAFKFAVTRVLVTSCALWAVSLRSSGILGCSAPMLPVMLTVPDAADALKVLICRVPSRPSTSAVMWVRFIPRT